MHPIDMARYFAQVGQHDDHPWKPMPWKGVYNKVLYCDPVMGTTIELARIDEGATFPVHYHPTVQTLFLLSGRIRDDNRDRIIEPGTFDIIPAGQRHAGYYAEEDSIQYKFFSATPVYIMEDGRFYYYRTDGTVVDGGNTDIKHSAENIMSIDDTGENFEEIAVKDVGPEQYVAIKSVSGEIAVKSITDAGIAVKSVGDKELALKAISEGGLAIKSVEEGLTVRPVDRDQVAIKSVGDVDVAIKSVADGNSVAIKSVENQEIAVKSIQGDSLAVKSVNPDTVKIRTHD
ncbi:cupin domain-containing protein [Cognatiyoonia sp. IB215182]|uniref:cupin domain-containing protein n=1 Tax=Cognatiyoonia sp. IB215182 TaxID=3097353 RepID=UPI002A1563D9|nr:cupin domain-containing protein [Cognatiyoonia sp. IB215182]MDX8354850.1 cupin domain-containing protein [Cognatiyoonia sp. IB215182]